MELRRFLQRSLLSVCFIRLEGCLAALGCGFIGIDKLGAGYLWPLLQGLSDTTRFLLDAAVSTAMRAVWRPRQVRPVIQTTPLLLACYFQLRFGNSGPAFVSKVRIQVVVAVGNHVSYRAVRRAWGEWRPELRSTMSKTMQGQRGLLRIVALFGSVLLFVCNGRHAVLQVQLQGGERVSCHGQELQVSRDSPVSSSERTSHDTCCQSVLIGATIALHGTTHNRFVRMNGCLADFNEAELQLSGSG